MEDYVAILLVIGIVFIVLFSFPNMAKSKSAWLHSGFAILSAFVISGRAALFYLLMCFVLYIMVLIMSRKKRTK